MKEWKKSLTKEIGSITLFMFILQLNKNIPELETEVRKQRKKVHVLFKRVLIKKKETQNYRKCETIIELKL